MEIPVIKGSDIMGSSLQPDREYKDALEKYKIYGF